MRRMVRRALGCLAIAVLLSACMSEERPESTLPAENTSGAAQAERLFVLDGGKLYEVVDGRRVLFAEGPDGASIFDASVSPDGSDVALSVQSRLEQTGVNYDFGVDLYVAHDHDDPFVIAAHEKIGETLSHPNWLPDGEQLIFMVLGRDETGGTDLHIDHINLQTGVQQRLVDNAIEPSLSHDGSTLAFVAYDIQAGTEVIMLADLATGQQHALLPADTYMTNVANIAWSPDDDRIAFAASDPLPAPGPAGGAGLGSSVVHPTLRDMWLVSADGSGLQRMTELADSTLSLAWSADDRHVYALGDTGFWRIDTQDGSLEDVGEPVLAGRVQTLIP